MGIIFDQSLSRGVEPDEVENPYNEDGEIWGGLGATVAAMLKGLGDSVQVRFITEAEPAAPSDSSLPSDQT